MIGARYQKTIERWEAIPVTYSEANLEADLMSLMWEDLGIHFPRVKKTPAIGSGLIPDYLLYQDPDRPPVLVVEAKRRVPALADAHDDFSDTCKSHPLYRAAVGYKDPGENGIRQYLDIERVNTTHLASYGLVFNGDFFQLWRRVDGLVFPLTPIQKVTRASIPALMQQLDYCLKNPQPALVASVWNQKGGVAKTTNTINLGATLALHGKRVLLIDLDPQGDLTRGVGASDKASPNYLESCGREIQLNQMDDAQSLLRGAIQSRSFPTTDGRKYTLSALSGSSDALKKFRDGTDLPPIPFFKRLVRLLHDDYDYIFIDVAPTPDKLMQSALFSCDAVLIPVDFGGKALHHAVEIYTRGLPALRDVRSKQEILHLGIATGYV